MWSHFSASSQQTQKTLQKCCSGERLKLGRVVVAVVVVMLSCLRMPPFWTPLSVFVCPLYCLCVLHVCSAASIPYQKIKLAFPGQFKTSGDSVPRSVSDSLPCNPVRFPKRTPACMRLCWRTREGRTPPHWTWQIKVGGQGSKTNSNHHPTALIGSWPSPPGFKDLMNEVFGFIGRKNNTYLFHILYVHF